jgi:hypothetical protein
MVKLGQRAVGALGAAGLLTGSQPSRYLGDAAAHAYPETTGYANDVKISAAEINRHSAEKAMHVARYRAAEPLREKLHNIRNGGAKHSVVQFLHDTSTHPHLDALRSTSDFWRASVRLDKAKARWSAAEQVERELQKLLSDPLDQLEESFRNAVGVLLAEMSKS